MANIAVNTTIIAQSTPQGSGAIALIRLSGPCAIEITDEMARFSRRGKKLATEPSHTIHFGEITAPDGAVIDQVLFLLMCAPQTFTGEDVVEISCHNNQFVIKAIIARAIALGARAAQRGEFTRRAVENGKIDLVKAEAINELIGAQTELALQKSLAQLSGSLSSWIGAIEKELVRALALCNASFEFLEEETNFAPELLNLITTNLEQIETIQQTHGVNAQIRQGIKIAIIGPVNAGKSSLFNKLLGQDRAIVTPIAGTTRDTVEATIDRAGVNWTLIDTAGIRQTADTIEQEGIKRSLDAAQEADIILLVFDGTATVSADLKAVYEQLEAEFEHKIIRVATKSDLAANANSSLMSFESAHPECFSAGKKYRGEDERGLQPTDQHNKNTTIANSSKKLSKGSVQENTYTAHPECLRDNASKCIEGHERVIPLSSRTGAGFAPLETAIQTKIQTLLSTANAPFLINERHHAILLELQTVLETVKNMVSEPIVHYELIAYHLQDALERISQLSGKSVSEAAMDKIFQDFCVGK